jgi:two-component system cell cycle response regulator DivK
MSRHTIAVIEDNEDNRLLLRALLDDLYDIREYGSGPSALEGMASFVPDLILLDISLPGMDGVEVLGVLREDPRLKSLPVIALTAHAMIGDRERLLDAGFDEYVPKPIVDENILLGSIERLIARSEA